MSPAARERERGVSVCECEKQIKNVSGVKTDMCNVYISKPAKYCVSLIRALKLFLFLSFSLFRVCCVLSLLSRKWF